MRRLIAAAISLALALFSQTVNAGFVSTASTSIQTVGSPLSDLRSTTSLDPLISSSFIDAANRADARATAHLGEIGVSIRVGDPNGGFADAKASYDDTWTCPGCVIAAPGQVAYVHLRLDGKLSPPGNARDFVEFFGSYHIDDSNGNPVVTLDFHLTGARNLSAQMCSLGCSDESVAHTVDASGNFVIAFDELIPFDLSFFSVDHLEMGADFDSVFDPQFVDFLHSFSADIVSTDPNFLPVSDGGRRAILQPISQVPEPATLALLAAAFGVLGLSRRRKS